MRQPPAKMRRLSDEWRWLYAAIVVLVAAVWLYTLIMPRFTQTIERPALEKLGATALEHGIIFAEPDLDGLLP